MYKEKTHHRKAPLVLKPNRTYLVMLPGGVRFVIKTSGVKPETIIWPSDGAPVTNPFDIIGSCDPSDAQVTCQITGQHLGGVYDGQPSPQSASGYDFQFDGVQADTYDVEVDGCTVPDTETIVVLDS